MAKGWIDTFPSICVPQKLADSIELAGPGCNAFGGAGSWVE